MKPDAMTQTDLNLAAILVGLGILLTGFIVEAPPVRSRLKTPTKRAIASGLLAAGFAVGGLRAVSSGYGKIIIAIEALLVLVGVWKRAQIIWAAFK
jgi:hypothetical protein